MDDFELELKTGFLDEADQCLDDCEKCFLDLTENRASPEVFATLFRLAHNLKGTSRAVGFNDMAEFTHALESLMTKLKSGELLLTEEMISVLLESNDHLRQMVKALRADFNAKVDSAALLQKIQALIQGMPMTAPALKSAEMAQPATGAAVAPAADRAAIEAPSAKATGPANPTAPTAPTAPAQRAPAGAAREEIVRVNLSKLDKLNNLAGEMAILQSVLAQHRDEIKSRLLLSTISQMGKIVAEVQSISMDLRMVPLKHTFQKLQRTVRDTALAIGKQVQLETFGDEFEVDRTILEHLADPLVHLVVNAIDHGLETPADRVVAGKNPVGRIRINVIHKGSHLLLELSDDGKGIDADGIRQKAKSLGLLTEEANPSESELFQFLFLPSFSTRKQVTAYSGRGVGLDIVSQSVKRLSGQISVESRAGAGTTFRILFPLTLAIIDGLVVTTGSLKCVIPLSHVSETLKPSQNDIGFVTGKGEVMELRGATVPVYSLGSILQMDEKPKIAAESIGLVCTSQNSSFVILVDQIIGQQQVVVKPIGNEVRNRQGLVGGAILGDGKPTVIFDPLDLVESLRKNSGPHVAVRGGLAS